jgi:hypothetical protein
VSTPVAILVTAAGILLILAALRDVFDTLFHPGGAAATSRAIMRVVWRAYHPLARRRPGAISLAGPTALIVIVALWASALVIGWALILWPHVPGDFSFQPGTEHGGLHGFVDALYYSMVTLATVGYGDITPDAAWLRIIGPLEALVGFGLLTASIAWLGAIYPVLTRRRALAYEIYLLHEAQVETETDVDDLTADSAAAIYGDLTSRVITLKRDLVAFPIAYYFAETEDRFSLAAAMPYLWRLAQQGAREEVDKRARMRAVMLRDAVADFAQTVAERFHGDPAEGTQELLDAYARDHLRDPHRPPADVIGETVEAS